MFNYWNKYDEIAFCKYTENLPTDVWSTLKCDCAESSVYFDEDNKLYM